MRNRRLFFLAAVVGSVVVAGCRRLPAPTPVGVAESVLAPDEFAQPAALPTEFAPLPQPLPRQLQPQWPIAVQSYSYRQFTLFETIDRLRALGVRNLEAYPGQRLREGDDAVVGPGMVEDARQALREKLKAAGVTLRSFGVASAGDPKGWRELFAFARDMGVETLVSEPDPASLDLVSQLADEFQINVAFHNHADPSRYWQPERVLETVKGRSKRLGACCDNGHWVRSGLDPVACFKALQGRVLTVHFKDMSALDKGAHCVPFGTGACDLDGMLTELQRQGFSGTLTIEYEHSPENPTPAIRQCVDYLCQWPAEPSPGEEMVSDVSKIWASVPVWRVRPGPIARVDTDSPAQVDWQAPIKGSGRKSARPAVEIDPGPVLVGTDSTDDMLGTITASAEGNTWKGVKEAKESLFDNDPHTKFCVLVNHVWVQYRYPAGRQQRVIGYRITATPKGAAKRSPRDWQLLGSNDGETWDVLDSRQRENFAETCLTRSFAVKKPGDYGSYRLNITANHGDHDLEFSGLALIVGDEPVSGQDTTTGCQGTVTASVAGNVWEGVKEGKENLFDDDLGTKYCVLTNAAWVEYAYPEGQRHRVTAYCLTTMTGAPKRCPRDWQLLGSNDGQTWTVLDHRVGEDFAPTKRRRCFRVSRPGEYSHYRLDITANHGDRDLELAELELLAEERSASR